ncbi:MAG TPA: hypothetical protein VGQ18_01695 [Gemmatimonadales bacterium]|jgi:hypothetical protein|nr:hypothetical protein [Gemmatimonadales bacterium]
MRPTPFTLAFSDLARERFPAIADVLKQDAFSSADRDRFVLLEPVGRLLREIAPEGTGPDALEAHMLMLHHAYRHWAGGAWVYRISEGGLERATTGKTITSHLPRPSLYLQLPELKVWGTPTPGGAPEPLDGVFVSETVASGRVAVLAIFGMREGRPGFSAVGLEGHADSDDASSDEIEVLAAREDGSGRFSPTLAGGEQAGLYSLANAGELLLLTCRLLAQLPVTRDAGNEIGDAMERIVDVD